MDELETFDAKAFIGRLLGKESLSELVRDFHEVVPADEQIDIFQRIYDGQNFAENFTFWLFQLLHKMKQLAPAALLGHMAKLAPNARNEL